MAYDNIQAEAAAAVKGMRVPRMPVEKKKVEGVGGVTGGLPEESGGLGT